MALQARLLNRQDLLGSQTIPAATQQSLGASQQGLFVHLPPNSLDYRDHYGLQQVRTTDLMMHSLCRVLWLLVPGTYRTVDLCPNGYTTGTSTYSQWYFFGSKNLDFLGKRWNDQQDQLKNWKILELQKFEHLWMLSKNSESLRNLRAWVALHP